MAYQPLGPICDHRDERRRDASASTATLIESSSIEQLKKIQGFLSLINTDDLNKFITALKYKDGKEILLNAIAMKLKESDEVKEEPSPYTENIKQFVNNKSSIDNNARLVTKDVIDAEDKVPISASNKDSYPEASLSSQPMPPVAETKQAQSQQVDISSTQLNIGQRNIKQDGKGNDYDEKQKEQISDLLQSAILKQMDVNPVDIKSTASKPNQSNLSDDNLIYELNQFAIDYNKQRESHKWIDVGRLIKCFTKYNYKDYTQLDFRKILKQECNIGAGPANKLWNHLFLCDHLAPTDKTAEINGNDNDNPDEKQRDEVLQNTKPVQSYIANRDAKGYNDNEPNQPILNVDKSTNVMKSSHHKPSVNHSRARHHYNQPNHHGSHHANHHKYHSHFFRQNPNHHQQQSAYNQNDINYSSLSSNNRYQQAKGLYFRRKYHDNNTKGNFYISLDMQWKIVKAIKEPFFTHDTKQKDVALFLNYFKVTSGMQINDGQIRVVYGGDGIPRILIDIDLHFRNDGQKMYLVAEQQNEEDRRKYGVEWKIVDMMTAVELNYIGIDNQDFPQSSRDRQWFKRELSYSPQNMTLHEIEQMLNRTNFTLKKFRADENDNKWRMQIGENVLKECCKEALWHKRLPPLPVLVIKGNQHWIEWKQIVNVEDEYGNTGWIAISLRYDQWDQRWNVEKIDDDGGVVYYKHRLVALSVDDECSYTYNQLQRWLGTSLSIFRD